MRRNAHGNHNMSGNPNAQLKDLDRELELLRQKRQLIEQEQQQYRSTSYNNAHPISPWEQSPQRNNYEYQQSYTQAHLANLYDSQPGSRPALDGPRRSRKRPAQRWNVDSSKRFRPQERRSDNPPPQKRFGSGPPKKFGSQPPKKFGSQPPKNDGSQAPKTQFAEPKGPRSQGPKKPFKKPNASADPGPNSQPSGSKVQSAGPNAGNAVPKNQKGATGPANAKTFEPFIFTNKKQTPRKVLGRLEFALGVVFKQLRTAYEGGPNAHLFDLNTNISGVKSLKKALRGRIQDAMLNKEVGEVAQVIAQYREMFPETGDEEFLQSVADAEMELKNIADKILSKKPDSAYLKTTVESDYPEEYFKINMQNVLEQSLNEMFTKVQKIYQDEAKANQEEATANQEEATANQEEAKADQDEAEPNQDEAKPNQTEGEEVNMTTEENVSQPEEAISSEKVPDDYDPANPTDVEANANGTAEGKIQEYKKLMEDLIKEKLPKVLPKFKEDLYRILKLDQEFLKARSYLFGQTAVKAKMAANAMSLQNRQKWGPLSFVLVQGNPTLPKKPALQAFLRHFNPRAIKKHKNIRNVLYVGFSDKTSFEEILKQNETILGESRLVIKESNKFQKSQNNDDAENIKKEEDQEGNDTKDENSILDQELNDNIDELLTSIKQQDDNGVQETTDNGNDGITDAMVDAALNDDGETADDVQIVDNGDQVVDLDAAEKQDPDNGEAKNGDEANKEAEGAKPKVVAPTKAGTPNTPTITTRRSSRLH